MSFKTGDTVIVHAARGFRQAIYCGEGVVLTVANQRVIWISLEDFQGDGNVILDASFCHTRCKYRGDVVCKRAYTRMNDNWKNSEEFINWCVNDVMPADWGNAKMIAAAAIGYCFLGGIPGAAIAGLICKNYL
jgi:hypothetical protein